MPAIDRIVVDRAPWATRLAFLSSGEVVELWVEGGDRPSRIGAVALGRVVSVDRHLGAATVAIPQGEVHVSDRKLDEGARAIVQVVRDDVAGKRAVARTDVELSQGPVVLTPRTPGVGLSSAIKGKARRAGLKAVLAEALPAETGLLIRSGGADHASEALVAAAKALVARWRDIAERAAVIEPPAWLESPLSPEEAARVLAPDVVPEVDGTGRAFRDCGGEEALEAALARRVPLPEGGELVIDVTEAGTMIDVNLPSGGGREGLRRANETAALAAVRQLRLRGTRGIVLVDLPRMTERSARDRVAALVAEMAADDPAPVRVLGWTPGGMLELVREGVRRPLADDLLEAPGTPAASVRAAAWAALAGLRRETTGVARPRLIVAPPVARWFDGPGRPMLEAERRRLGHLSVAADPALRRDESRVESED